MSTKKINAGDTLTVGDLTDDHLGAEIEVGVPEGIRYRLTLRNIDDSWSAIRVLVPEKETETVAVSHSRPVTVIAPPPVAQPDEPTILGQCIRIEGDEEFLAVLIDSGDAIAPFCDADGNWWGWDEILGELAQGCQIIVSDPPRWPDETPVVPERIEVVEWPDDDTHLRAWKWIDLEGDPWWWDAQVGLWRAECMTSDRRRPLCGPWTRGERVE